MSPTSSDIVFQVSDLAKKRVEVVDAARAGGARVRDKDGTSLVMLPERRLHLLEDFARWSGAQLRLEELLRRSQGVPSVQELGNLAWLRVFSREDLREFLDDLHEALVVSYSDQDTAALDECLRSWQITARQAEDPLRRRVLSQSPDPASLTDAADPSQLATEDDESDER